ncbi:transcriptional regulator [Escherichia coli]|nr:transcriptional regulator [Escherichia coli]EFN6842488.1 transcriptional regulator [Escherichia coli H51]EFB8833374.1 transcriptional regulator [Escherichia coli]EFB9821135.1 transcriptional regulator [Escherichia coli]EFC1909457.1 transcriptional regulator [Escherichia coli]
MRAEASFRNPPPPGFRYGSAIAIPPFISGQPHSRLFFTFLPGCYAGEGGALFS